MKQHRNVINAVIVTGFAILFLVSIVPPARTYPLYLTSAQKLGFPAKDCSYCHLKASGGSGWNARGKWLISEKEKRGADTIEVSWLKDYKASAGASSKSHGKKKH